MHYKSLADLKEYYLSIIKERLGEEKYNSILKDMEVNSHVFDNIVDKYRELSKMPNHIHLMSLVDKYKINNTDQIEYNNDKLLRGIILLCKFHEQLNSDFSIKSELEIIDVLFKFSAECEFFNSNLDISY